MNEILYTNIFFVIASVASVIFLIFVCVILFNIIKILQLVRSVLERVDNGSKVLSEDLTKLRASMTGLGFFSGLFNFFFRGNKEEEKLPVKKVMVKKTVTKRKNTKVSSKSKK